ncbi:MAG: hypothetical protein AW11_01692 [Candidatus Accumulibacter regalis]|uniref:Uncharacterized protein n=1 Tax=Accumulibacter regalis TaxID=522306 RepID=A0A011QIL1_ACCRE|nr:MAG: hypothetical protein AW11_01692 [Candidatus Accumulibacter regalis]
MSIGESTRAPKRPRRGSREHLNAIVETTSDGILIPDLRGKVLYGTAAPANGSADQQRTCGA